MTIYQPFFFDLFFCFVFFVTSGVIYDIINEPPSMGSKVDRATGRNVLRVFFPGNVNRQFVIEGIMGGIAFVLGAFGVVLLDLSSSSRSRYSRQTRGALALGAGACSLCAVGMVYVFMRLKMPGYME